MSLLFLFPSSIDVASFLLETPHPFSLFQRVTLADVLQFSLEQAASEPGATSSGTMQLACPFFSSAAGFLYSLSRNHD